MFDLVFKTVIILGVFFLPIVHTKFPNRCYMGLTRSLRPIPVPFIADACILRINMNNMQPSALYHTDSHHHLGPKVENRNKWHREKMYNCGLWEDKPSSETWVICACYTDLCNRPFPYDDLFLSGKNVTWRNIPTPDVTDYFP